MTDGKPETPETDAVDLTKSSAEEAPAVELADSAAEDNPVEETAAAPVAVPKRRFSPVWAVTLGLLAILTLLLAGAAWYLNWNNSSRWNANAARTESVQVAKDSTVALLSYKAETVDKDLGAARDRLTGSFLDAYTQLVNNVVIPGAKEKKISAVAQVPAAASVSVTPDRAVALLFVNQTVVMGTDPPSTTTSSVRVTLDKVNGRWLISGFDPV